MNCNLSSTGLQDINSNEIATDNLNVFSNLNVSGFTILNNRTTILSSLSVSGHTNFNEVSIRIYMYLDITF